MKVVLKDITKKFPSRSKKGEEVVAVKDFSFEAPDGKLVGLLGPSGCGKSTILNIISGLETPTSGRVFFGEDDVTDIAPENRGVGLVFQNYALYPHMTVRQNILFPLQNLKGEQKLSKADMEKRALEAAKLVQIDGLMDRRPAQMSGGQQQRVAIARALVKMPRVLLLDEPLSNLDARLRLQTREEIRRIQRETGITTIFVTHDQEEALSITDVIAVMDAGVMQQTGRPQQVYDDPVNLFVAKFLGTPAINVFEGEIRGGRLYLGEDDIMELDVQEGPCEAACPERKVLVGIRPEGFIPDPKGLMSCTLKAVEVMGRDTSVVCAHPSAPEASIRAIIGSENRVDESASAVSFRLRPGKVLLFDRDSRERIRFRA